MREDNVKIYKYVLGTDRNNSTTYYEKTKAFWREDKKLPELEVLFDAG